MRLVIFLTTFVISFNVFAGDEEKVKQGPVSYTHLTLPTTPYV